MGASLLRHIHIYVEEDHRVSKVLPRARVQDQNSIVGRGGSERRLVLVESVPSVQHPPNTKTSAQLGGQRPA